MGWIIEYVDDELMRQTSGVVDHVCSRAEGLLRRLAESVPPWHPASIVFKVQSTVERVLAGCPVFLM